MLEIEAEVDVEIGKLSNKLAELNIDAKFVGTDEFKVIAQSIVNKNDEFKQLAQKIIYDPLIENKSIYNIKIVNVEPVERLNENIKKNIKMSNNGIDLLLTFELCLNEDYITGIVGLLKKFAKNELREHEFKKNTFFVSQLNDFKCPPEIKRRTDVCDLDLTHRFISNMCLFSESRVIKGFELDESYGKIIEGLNSNYFQHKKEPVVVVDLIDNKNEILKSVKYKFYGSSLDTMHYYSESEKRDIFIVKKDCILTSRAEFISGFLLLGNTTLIINKSNQFGTIFNIDASQIVNLNSVKIQIVW